MLLTVGRVGSPAFFEQNIRSRAAQLLDLRLLRSIYRQVAPEPAVARLQLSIKHEESHFDCTSGSEIVVNGSANIRNMFIVLLVDTVAINLPIGPDALATPSGSDLSTPSATPIKNDRWRVRSADNRGSFPNGIAKVAPSATSQRVSALTTEYAYAINRSP